jgi:sugar transferase (PEP-CTERM/EpsH1 system associated)
MRIAYIVPYVPNQIRTRSYNLISHLAHLGHEVHVFTVGSNHRDRQDAEFLRSRCTKVVYYHQPLWRSLTNSFRATFSRKPLQAVYSWQPRLAEYLVQAFAAKNGAAYDVVHVEHLRGSQYGILLKSRYPKRPVVWDSVDCISHLFQQASAQSADPFGRFVTRFELERTRRMEGELVSQFDHVLVTSPVDRKALLALAKEGRRPAPTSVLSNGVDQEFFHPNPDIQRDPDTLVFTGKMSYHANISMVRYLVEEIMPRVWKRRPTTRLYIVGKDPSRAILDFGKHPLITVTGTVDDIRPFLWRATVAVVPLLYGAGIQNKILEAMATGTPVITTARSLLALQAEPGKELLAANDSDEFAAAVLQLIENPQMQREIGSAGESYVRTHHNWTSAADRLVDIYQLAKEQAYQSNPGH